MATGERLVRLAETRIGEKYVNVLVPKDNPNWHGPWDCAEFASWAAYQVTGKLFGCTDNAGVPSVVEAYSGAWARDAQNGTLLPADLASANVTPGIVLIRKPPLPGAMGHIAIADGFGGTIEAAGKGLGVRRGKVEGRQWHFFCLIPNISYIQTRAVVKAKPIPYLLTLEEPNISGPLVRKVQKALNAAGCNPGVIDGQYGPHTVAAVYAFQKQNRLVADGVVGPATAKSLGVAWPSN